MRPGEPEMVEQRNEARNGRFIRLFRRSAHSPTHDHITIPAKAGTHSSTGEPTPKWVPAFAGMVINMVIR